MKTVKLLFLAIFFPSFLFAQYSGGNGSSDNPYKLSTCADLEKLMNSNSDWNKHFIMTSNIDLSGYTPTQGGIKPIGDGISDFSGSFDGQSKCISNLAINTSSNSYVGLFACTASSATITDLSLQNINITGNKRIGGLVGENFGIVTNCSSNGIVSGNEHTGGLIGYNYGSVSNCDFTGSVSGKSEVTGGLVGFNSRFNGYVSNCYSGGTVSGTSHVGGLIGYNDTFVSNCYSTSTVLGSLIYTGGLIGSNRSTVSSCHSSGNVVGIGEYVGGLIGANDYGSVEFCYSTGNVTGDAYVGGLIGENIDGSVDFCYSTGNVTGSLTRSYYTGGLIGYHEDAEVSNCYSTGDVTGLYFSGGFIGQNYGVVDKCYSTGSASGSYAGGLIADNIGRVRNSFWDTETSGNTTSSGGTSKTSALMKTQSTFTGAGWDFTNDWAICQGYPELIHNRPKNTEAVYINSSYTEGSTGGYVYNCNAFSNIENAKEVLSPGGKIYIFGNYDFETDPSLDGYQIYISGSILNADEDNFFNLGSTGSLTLSTASPVTFPVGTDVVGYAPVVINAPSSNTFTVSITDSTSNYLAKVFYSKCWWDIEHTGGNDPTDIDFVYNKSLFTRSNPLKASYVLHFDEQWENLTPDGAATLGNWNGDENYFCTSITNVSSFSPFSVHFLPKIPSVSVWALIILGITLAISGGWILWKRF